MAKVESTVYDWVNETNGILVKEDRDTYVYIFEQRYLDKIKEDIKYIYYRFNKEGIIEESSSLLFNITTNLLLSENKRKNNYIIKHLKKKYVNTGMPAPDGYYYQQGDPDNMIYDPDNISHVKKREIIKWKSKKN